MKILTKQCREGRESLLPSDRDCLHQQGRRRTPLQDSCSILEDSSENERGKKGKYIRVRPWMRKDYAKYLGREEAKHTKENNHKTSAFMCLKILVRKQREEKKKERYYTCELFLQE